MKKRTQEKQVQALFERARQFTDDPRTAARLIARMGRKYGYSFIQPAAITLEQIHCNEDLEKYAIAVQLRQPEYVWKRAKGVKDRIFFGVMEEEQFSPRGYYLIKLKEDGRLTILFPDADPLHQEFTTSPDRNPIDCYKARKTKFRTLRVGSQYYVVEVGRIVDLVKYGYDRTSIQTTYKIQYLWKYFKGFVYRSEGFKTEDEARAYEATLALGGIQQKE